MIRFVGTTMGTVARQIACWSYAAGNWWRKHRLPACAAHRNVRNEGTLTARWFVTESSAGVLTTTQWPTAHFATKMLSVSTAKSSAHVLPASQKKAISNRSNNESTNCASA
ncbi:hypothetical protein M514_21989 [Trichuris suis]|uniref:Uncharacterized protein n=1 Tax=Trichuris suis TaxID=68888 RepID=A0A085N8U4_9BILA|nr:hypothetical protein M514_21989 [Trichuris suis]